MFDVGSLVAISKTVLESFKLVKDLLGGAKGREAEQAQAVVAGLRTHIDKFQERLEGLAIQLQQSERLTRMIPAWEAYANNIDISRDVASLSDDDAQKIHVNMRNLIESSIRDQFSGTFFRTDFDALPGMKTRLDIFRDHLNNLDRTVSTIPAGSLPAFKALWPTLCSEFNNLRNSGYQVRRLAEDTQGQLIDELLESTREARKALARMS
jgi:hypothetical protein